MCMAAVHLKINKKIFNPPIATEALVWYTVCRKPHKGTDKDNDIERTKAMGTEKNKKFELTEETMVLDNGKVLHRIRAVSDFTLSIGATVHAGDLGGWVEKEDNLSQSGKAWVYGDARVYGEARVYDDARVFGKASVYGYAEIFGDARVYEEAVVHCDSGVCGEAHVYGTADVGGSARVNGSAEITGDAHVKGPYDYAVFKNTWSSGRWFTYTRSDRMWTVGCFRGTGDELIAKAYKDSELSGQCYETIVKAQEAIENATDYGKRKSDAAE